MLLFWRCLIEAMHDALVGFSLVTARGTSPPKKKSPRQHLHKTLYADLWVNEAKGVFPEDISMMSDMRLLELVILQVHMRLL